MATVKTVTTWSDEASEDRDLNRTYTIVKRLETEDQATTAEVRQINHVNLPRVGQLLADDLQAEVKSVRVRRVDDTKTVFDWEAEFSTKEERAQSRTQDPLAQPNRVNWDAQEGEESYFTDQEDNEVTNSIGQQFQELPKRFKADWTVTVRVNQSSFNISLADSLVDTVNNGTITISDGQSNWGIAADSALLVSMSPSELKKKNGVFYYEVQYVFKLKSNGWNGSEVFKDYGTYVKDGTEWAPEFDSQGGEVTELFPLDGSGNRQPAGTAAADLSFKPYVEANHSALPLA